MKILLLIFISFFFLGLAFAQSDAENSILLVRDSETSGDYLTPGNVLNLGTENFTIELKMIVNSFPPISVLGSKLINKGLSFSGTPSNAGYGIRIWEDDGNNKLIFEISDGSEFNGLEIGGLSTGTCYHVVAVRDGINLKLYLNGELVASNLTTSLIDVNSNLFFAIGALSRQPVGFVNEFFDGQLDEIRIWNVVRSIEQINEMMNDTLTAPYYTTSDSGLIAYYRCDEFEDLGKGSPGVNDIRDYSISGFHSDSYGASISAVMCNVSSIHLFNIDLNIEFILVQNYPNPFNPDTKIRWQSPIGSRQVLKVYDILGNEVVTLVDEYREAGRYEVTFYGSTLASGMYIYRLQSGDFVQAKKMILMK